MEKMKNAQLLTHLEWRYAVKKFDAQKKLSPEDWSTLEKALLLTPSSYGLQPWKFVIVLNQDVRKQLRAASWNQSQVEDCSHYVVLCQLKSVNENYIKSYMDRIAEVRGIATESLAGFHKTIVGDVIHGPRAAIVKEWAARQCYIALGNLMTAAAVLGVDACPMEGLNPEKYDEILGLKHTDYTTVVACAIGYRSADDVLAKAKKVRFPADKIIEIR